MGDFDSRECPFCGADVPVNAIRCRECGASDEYGWNSVEDQIEGLGGYGEDDDFDYDEFVAREFPDQSSGSQATTGVSMTARFVILALVISLILTFVLV